MGRHQRHAEEYYSSDSDSDVVMVRRRADQTTVPMGTKSGIRSPNVVVGNRLEETSVNPPIMARSGVQPSAFEAAPIITGRAIHRGRDRERRRRIYDDRYNSLSRSGSRSRDRSAESDVTGMSDEMRRHLEHLEDLNLAARNRQAAPMSSSNLSASDRESEASIPPARRIVVVDNRETRVDGGSATGMEYERVTETVTTTRPNGRRFTRREASDQIAEEAVLGKLDDSLAFLQEHSDKENLGRWQREKERAYEHLRARRDGRRREPSSSNSSDSRASSERRVKSTLKPARLIRSPFGVLNADVDLSSNPGYQNLHSNHDHPSPTDFAKVKKYLQEIAKLDALVAIRILKAEKYMEVSPSAGIQFAWVESNHLDSNTGLPLQHWIHGQSKGLSNERLKSFIASLPYLDTVDRALTANLLTESESYFNRYYTSRKYLEPLTRRVDAIDSQLGRDLQNWTTLLNIPYLSIGVPRNMGPAEPNSIQSRPLLHFLYPLEAFRTAVENRQALHRNAYLRTDSAVMVSQFLAVVSSSGFVITFCPQSFSALQKPLHRVISDAEPATVSAPPDKSVLVRLKTNESFAFRFPLRLCTSYFALISTVSNAYREFCRRSSNGLTIQGDGDLVIDHCTWVTYYSQSHDQIINIFIVEELSSTDLQESPDDTSQFPNLSRSDTASTEDKEAPHTSNHSSAPSGRSQTVPFFKWCLGIPDDVHSTPEEGKLYSANTQKRNPEPKRRRTGDPYISRRHTKTDLAASTPTATDRILDDINLEMQDMRRSRIAMNFRNSITSFLETNQAIRPATGVESEISKFTDAHIYGIADSDIKFRIGWQQKLQSVFRSLDDIRDAFCPRLYPHTILNNLDVLQERTVMNIASTLRRINTQSDAKQTTPRPVEERAAANQRQDESAMSKSFMLFDTKLISSNDGRPSLFFGWQDRNCHSNFDTHAAALEHLKDKHIPDGETATDQELRQFIVSEIQYPRLLAGGQIGFFLDAVGSHVRQIENVVQEIHLAVAVADKQKQSFPPLPHELFRAYCHLLLFFIVLDRMVSSIKDASYSDLWKAENSTSLLLRDSVVKMTKILTKALHLVVKAKTKLERTSLPSGHSAYQYYEKLGHSFLLSTFISGLCNASRDEIRLRSGLTILQAFDQYAERLNYQVQRHPRRRLRNEIVQCREEIATIRSIFNCQHQTVSQLASLLDDKSFRKPSPERKFQFYFEQEILSNCGLDLLDRRQFCEELLSEFDRLESELVRALEIEQDDNSKAITAFTIVTVVFLPLSFATSYLGMNTTDIRNMNSGQWLFYAIALPLTLLTMAAAIVVGYYGENIRDMISNFIKFFVPSSRQKSTSIKDASTSREPILPRKSKSRISQGNGEV